MLCGGEKKKDLDRMKQSINRQFEWKEKQKQKTHQMRSVQIFDYAQEFSRGLVLS